ncbi:hypothetical protein [Bacillus sp. JCM 19034]|uniref:hypothetical protein n=1 Tax=Bacillus sp. JCM 19034 TaxID=1481928 RepID=UPI000784EE29|nr:hypothetical protein [Bacillus sp. JCM 19034]
MGNLVNLLNSQKMNLIVSLPANSMDHVKAAAEGGADVIKVHMNVEHRASGNSFGSFDDNEGFFQEMNGYFSGITGVVPGDSLDKVKQPDIVSLKKIGFDFVSIYSHTAPAWLLEDHSLDKMIAISNKYTDYELHSFNAANIQIVETSIMNPDDYGTSLSIQDILHYQYLLSKVNGPIVIPTQKKITLQDLTTLYKIGVHGFMIGAVVTGKTADQLYEATKAYKEEIERLRR